MRLAVFGVLDHMHTRSYLDTLAQIPDADVVALYDPDPEKTRLVLKAPFEHVPVYGDPLALLAAHDVQAAMLFLPNRDVPPLMTELARRKIHIWVEKPMAGSAAALDEPARLVKENGLVCYVGYQWRYAPTILEIRRLVQGGALGKLWSIEMRMVTSHVKSRGPEYYLFKKDISGGGILNWLGCHYIDLMRFITGTEAATVSCLMDNVGGEAIDVEDAAMVSLRFANGMLGSLHAGYFLPEGYETFLGIRGSEGWITFDLQTTRFTVHSNTADWWPAPRRAFDAPTVHLDGYGAMGKAIAADFLAAAQGRIPPKITIDDAIATLKVVDAAYESARSGCAVNLR